MLELLCAWGSKKKGGRLNERMSERLNSESDGGVVKTARLLLVTMLSSLLCSHSSSQVILTNEFRVRRRLVFSCLCLLSLKAVL